MGKDCAPVSGSPSPLAREPGRICTLRYYLGKMLGTRTTSLLPTIKSSSRRSRRVPGDKDEFPTDKDEFPTDKDEFPTDKDEFPADKDEFPTDKDEFPTDKGEFPADKDEFRRPKILMLRTELPSKLPLKILLV